MGGRRRRPGRVMTRRAARGRTLYTAMYWHGDEELSAGTFDSYDEAEAAWLTQADSVRRGTHLDPRKSRTLFRDFAETWRLLYVVERGNTANGYDDALRRHLLPRFGAMQMGEIDVLAVQNWIKSLDRTHQPSTQRTLKGQLSGILTTALQWGYISVHPCAGVKVAKEGPRRIHAMERWEFDKLDDAMPGPVSRMLVWLDVNSGLRWGEISELRVHDVFDLDDDEREDDVADDVEEVYLHVTRSVSDVGPKYGDDGGRFRIEDTTKGKQDRKVSLDAETSRRLLDHIDRFDLAPGDLLFALSLLMAEIAEPVTLEPIPDDLGRTEPNAAGRTYAHGSPSGYSAGRCRCAWCRKAMARYRAQRRAHGLDLKARRPSVKGQNISGHCPRDTFRREFWRPAVQASAIREKTTFHDLRHTHATWLAKRGVDLQELQERLGHKRLSTTQIYIDATKKVRTGAAHLMGTIMAEPVTKQSTRRRRQLPSVG